MSTTPSDLDNILMKLEDLSKRTQEDLVRQKASKEKYEKLIKEIDDNLKNCFKDMKNLQKSAGE